MADELEEIAKGLGGRTDDDLDALAKSLGARTEQQAQKPRNPSVGQAALMNMAANLAGLPADISQAAINLGIAGYGTVKVALGGTPPDLMSNSFLTSDYIKNKMRESGAPGLIPDNPNPSNKAQGVAYDIVSKGGAIPGGFLPAAAATAAERTLGHEWGGVAAFGPQAVIKVVNAATAKSRDAAAARDALKDKTITEAREQGLVFPPSQINPGAANTVLEGFAGKGAVQEKASLLNQPMTNAISRRSIGIADDSAISEKSLDKIRKEEGKAYQAVKDFGQTAGLKFKSDIRYKQDIAGIDEGLASASKEFPDLIKNTAIERLKMQLDVAAVSPAAALEMSRFLRKEASANFKGMDDPQKLALARAQREGASALESLLERRLVDSGRKDLVDDFRAARTRIARTHDIESALNSATGDVSAAKLLQIANKGRPLGGGLDVVSKAAEAFPKSMREPSSIGAAPGFDRFDAWAGIFAAGGAAGVNPLLGLAGVARPVIRRGLLTQTYQGKGVSDRSGITPANEEQLLLQQALINLQNQ